MLWLICCNVCCGSLRGCGGSFFVIYVVAHYEDVVAQFVVIYFVAHCEDFVAHLL